MSNDREFNDMLEAIAQKQRDQYEAETVKLLAAGKPTHHMDLDIQLTPEIVTKVRSRDDYAQHLYAAMCNVSWQEQDVWEVLRDQCWSCTWRYAGGIVARIREQGTYMDWYCSGMGSDDMNWWIQKGFVSEATITDEIRQDLAAIGWHPHKEHDDQW